MRLGLGVSKQLSPQIVIQLLDSRLNKKNPDVGWESRTNVMKEFTLQYSKLVR